MHRLFTSIENLWFAGKFTFFMSHIAPAAPFACQTEWRGVGGRSPYSVYRQWRVNRLV